MKIIVKITLAVLIILSLGFWFLNDQQFEDVKKSHRQAVEEPLVDIAVLLASQVSKTYPDLTALKDSLNLSKEVLVKAKIYEIEKNQFDLRVYVVDSLGIVIFDSAGRDQNKDFSLWNDVIQAKKGLIGSRSSKDDATNPNQSILYVSAPIFNSGRIIGSLTVGKSTKSLNKQVANTYSSTLYYSAITFSLIAALSLLLIYLIIKPIEKLTKYAASVRDGKLVKLPKLPNGEIKLLGNTFEEMRNALEGKKYIEKYVQTLTHEIKSPITAISGAAEILSEDVSSLEKNKFTKIILNEVKRLGKFASNLMTLTSLQNQHKLELISINLFDLTESVISEYFSVIQVKQLIVENILDQDLTIIGDRFLLSKAIGNILSNAIEFSENNKKIIIKSEKLEKQCKLIIIDQGPGIPVWAFPKIFDQFFSLPRPDTNQRSSGLGLSLVKEIMELHGGSLAAENLVEGGAIFSLSFFKNK